MKKICYIIFSLLLLTSCTKKSDDIEDTLLGKWELVETQLSDGGGSSSWIEVNPQNSYFILFNSNNTFSSNRFVECTSGNYTFDFSTFSLAYGCSEFTAGIEDPPGTFTENYYFENGFLIITPMYLNCDEECNYKFKKTANDQ